MKVRLMTLLAVLTIVFTLLGLDPTSSAVAAGSCKNVTCEGLNPPTMG